MVLSRRLLVRVASYIFKIKFAMDKYQSLDRVLFKAIKIAGLNINTRVAPDKLLLQCSIGQTYFEGRIEFKKNRWIFDGKSFFNIKSMLKYMDEFFTEWVCSYKRIE